MGLFDKPFDFNGDGVESGDELWVGMQMFARSRQEAIDLTGSDAFYPGKDRVSNMNSFGDGEDLNSLDSNTLAEMGFDPHDFD